MKAETQMVDKTILDNLTKEELVDFVCDWAVNNKCPELLWKLTELIQASDKKTACDS